MATERERDEAGALLKRLEKKRKLFGFLRRHRHKLVDDEFQAELEAMHRGTGAGKEPVPPGQMAMALLLQGYLVLSDWDAVETSVIGSPALRRGLDRPRASRCRGVWVATSFRETRQRSGRTIVYGPGEGGAANPFGLMEFATITASLPDGTALEPVARTTRFDPHGRVASVTDSTGRAETFTYDSLGRLRSRVIAGSPGQTWTYGYTHGDNRLVLEEKLAETGYASTKTYDDGLLASEAFAFGNGQTGTRGYAYSDGRLETVTEDGGWPDVRVTRRLTYDGAGQVSSVGAIHYGRDADGRITTITDQNGQVTSIAYDKLGRPVRWDYGNGDAVEVRRDAFGAVTWSKHGNHAVKTERDALGGARSIQSEGTPGGIAKTIAYDRAGRPTHVVDQVSGLVEDFEYQDVLGRLTRRVRTIQSGTTASTSTETRSYTVGSGITTVLIERSVGDRVETETLEQDVLTDRVLAEGGRGEDHLCVPRARRDEERERPVAIERTHDARGHLLAETRGVVTTAYGIDAFGQVRDQRGPHALEHWTFDYDDDGQLTSRVLAEAGTTPGATWSYAYDATSVEETGPEATITRTVNARGRVKSESISGSSGDARVTEHTWDGPWVAKTITTQGDSTLTVEAAQDDRGREWSRSERWSGGGEWYAYASTSPWSGRTAAVEDVWTSGNRSASRSGELETDSLGNVVRASFGADDTWTYDAEGVLVAEARAGEAPVEYRYAGSRLEQRIQGDETTVYGHDAYGRITSTMDPANVTHEFRYGPTGLLEFERHGAEFVELTYDGGGFLASRTRNGRVTYRYTHGPRGELQQVAAPFGSYELSNDAGARLTGLTMPGGPMPSLGFGYDHLGRETSRRRGSAAWTTRWSGATATTAGPNGDVATSVVDPRGRTMKSTYAAGATSVSGRAVRFDYDGLDRPLGGDDEHGSTTYAYDSAGRLNAITRSGATVAYGLDGFGRVESVSSPGGVVTYGYDGYGRVSRIGSEGRETTVLWEPGGERLASLSDETLVEQRCYDANGRLTRLVHGGPGTGCASLGPDVVAYGYAYDGDGNVQRETYEARGETQFREYAYEHGERLQRVDDVTGGRTTSWTLANDGSRLLEEEGALGASPTTRLRYGYDPQGGLASITDEAIGAAVATYETDLAGRVQRELRHGEGVTRRYGWSADDRLVSLIATETATGAAGSSAVIAYDYAGRRVAQTGGSGTASWMWDDAGLVEESLPGFGSAVYERVGGTVAAVGGARVLHDRLESIVGFAGGPAFRHDAWGRYLGASPEPALPGVGYAGQRWDADLGLSYAQQRWYQPGVGRFLSEDPIGATEERLREPGRLQTFAYAAANPLRWTDPLGLDVGQPESTSARAQEDMAYQAILNERNRDEGNWLQGCAAGEVDDWRNLDGAALNSSSHSPQWLAGYMRCNARPVSDAVYNSDAAKTTREFWTATPARAQVMSCVLGGGNGVLPVGGVNGLPASMQSTAAMCEFGVGAATAVVTAGELGVSGYRALKNLRPPSGPAPAFAAVRTDGRAAVVADEVSAAERIPTSFEARAHDTGSKPPAATKAGRGSEDASASNSGRAPWGITKEGTTRVVEHPRFGKFYKAKSDGLWWSKDRAGHGSQGRPQWKVFEETADGLKWKADANEFGDFIEDKHKGSVGLHIPWSDVGGR